MTKDPYPPLLHHYDLTILECHLDTFGHVNHAKYFELLEEARWDLITHRGFGLKEIQRSGLGPVILEAKIQYRRELTLREKIRIETKVISYNRKIATIGQTITNSETKVCAIAEIVLGLWDIRKRKIITPTPEWMMAIGLPDVTAE